MKKLTLLIALLLIVTISLVACGQSTEQPSGSDAPDKTTGNTPGKPDDEKVLHISLATELQTLNVLGQQNIVTNEVLSNIYDTLLILDQEANISPNVAESWDWNEGENKYTFHIKKGIKFHDGSELKASDVKFSFDLIQGEFASFQSSLANVLTKTEIVDDYTLDVYLKEPCALLLYYCCTDMRIFKKDAYDETNGYTEGIISCGPYKLVKYDPVIGVELEAFDDYHGESKPAIKHVQFDIIPDPNTQVIALQSGGLNISRDYPASAIKTIKDDPNLDIYAHKCGLVYFVQFNLRGDTIEPLKNQKVRQAINYALDKQAMILIADEGVGEVANSIANKNMFGYSEEIPYYEYNLDKAKELMKDAGYEDGFEISTIYTRDGKDKKIAEIVLDNLTKIGIKTNVTLLENNAFIENLRSGNFFVAVSHLNLNTDADHTFLVLSKTGSIPFSGIDDEYIEEQNKKQLVELDRDKRFKILNDTLVHVSEQAYYAPCYYPLKSYAHTADVGFNGYDPFVGLQLKFLYWK